MNFPGHQPKPTLHIVPDTTLDTYAIEFIGDREMQTVKASYVTWTNAFVRFYEEVSDTEHVLVAAINASLIESIAELTDH